MHSKLSLLSVVGFMLATGPRGTKASPTCLSEGSCNDVPLPSKISKRHWYDDPDWVPAEGGCWSDNVDGVRALDYMIEDCDEMTPGKCKWLCKNSGFSLAGVEYSTECCACSCSPFPTTTSSLPPLLYSDTALFAIHRVWQHHLRQQSPPRS